MRLKKTNQQMLNNHVVLENGCHAYLGMNKDPLMKHRPKTVEDGLQVLISRRIYEIVFGAIPAGMVVRHKCDNGYCVNPNHLEIGTAKQNVQDMVDRGRSLVGSKNPSAKLTELDVAAMRSEWVPYKVSINRLAEKYGVDRATIVKVLHGDRWGHVAGAKRVARLKVGGYCPNGHLLDGENLNVRKSGRIDCRTCIKENRLLNKDRVNALRREQYKKKKLAEAAVLELIEREALSGKEGV